MTRNITGRIGFVPLLALALLLSALPVPGVESGEGGAAPRAFVKGPYLQNLSTVSVTVCWETAEPTNATVRYGVNGSLDRFVPDETLSTFHELVLGGLEADTTYDYLTQSSSTASAPSTFRTAPAGRAPFRFAVYGDCRTGHPNHTKVMQMMRSADPRFILSTGDLVESGGSGGDWQTFFDIVSPVCNDTPYWPSIGNHDTPVDNYLGFFSLPGNERWYSFDYGRAHFVALDTTDNIAEGSAQYEWLRSDLERANASAEWKLVFFHHPPYSSGLGHGSDLAVRNALDPIFVRYGVDAVFTGHDHDYEHADPGNGVQYFVTGGGGAPLSPSGRSNFTIYSETAYHFLSVDINADGRHAAITATREDGSVMETVRLAHVPRPPSPPAALGVTANTTTNLTLGWTPPSDPYLAGYNLTVSSNGSVLRYLFVGPVASFTVENLSAARNFTFALRALYVDPLQSPAGYDSTPIVATGRTAEVVRHPPSVSISAPARGQIFDYGRPVNCSAVVSDGGTGPFPVVEWRLDGILQSGTGANLSLGSVAPGNHTLAVKATDSLGDSSEYSVTFTVLEKPLPRPVPPVDTGPRPPVLLAAVVAILLILGMIMFVAGSRRSKQ